MTAKRTIEVEVDADLAEQLHEPATCPICGQETIDHARYKSCPEHGAVLKAVQRIVGYRPLSKAKKDQDGTEAGENQ